VITSSSSFGIFSGCLCFSNFIRRCMRAETNESWSIFNL